MTERTYTEADREQIAARLLDILDDVEHDQHCHCRRAGEDEDLPCSCDAEADRQALRDAAAILRDHAPAFEATGEERKPDLTPQESMGLSGHLVVTPKEPVR